PAAARGRRRSARRVHSSCWDRLQSKGVDAMRSNAMKLFRSRVLLVGAVLAVACLAQAMTATLATAAAPTKTLVTAVAPTNCWRFDETSGTTAANSAPGPSLTPQGGAAFATGCVGNDLHLGASTSDFAQGPAAPSVDFGTGNFTLGATVRISGGTTSVRTIIDHRSYSAGSPQTGYTLAISFGQPVLVLN